MRTERFLEEIRQVAGGSKDDRRREKGNWHHVFR